MEPIYLYDEIESGAAARVINQLRQAGNAEVSVRINSPGGDVSEGIAIYNALKPYKPTVYIDGVAASVASFIAMAGARIVAAENSLLMIHNPWTQAGGDSIKFRQVADALDKHRDALIGGYLRTGLPRSELTSLLDAETWLTADDALSMGFVDEIAEPQRFAAHAPECFSGYHNTPKDLLMNNNTSARTPRAIDTQTPAVPPVAPNTDLEKADSEKALAAFKSGLGSDGVAKAAYDAVMRELRDRNENIQALFSAFHDIPGIRGLEASCMANPRMTMDEVRAKLLQRVPNGASPIGALRGADQSETDFVQAASDSLLVRAGIRVEKPHPGMRDVMGMGLKDIVRACVSRSGGAFGRDDSSRSNIRAAMSTSDFPAILGNTLNKALRAGYETEPATFTAWTRHVLVPDFKEQTRVLLGSAPTLLRVLEGGEYENGAIDEDKSLPYKVDKFGRIIQLTWESIVNDDLGAFLRITQAMGQTSARAEADLIYQTFADNAGAGPVMQDTNTLFHASHGNLAAAVSSINADALGVARVLLRRQTAPGGGVLNLVPRFLMVAPEHEQAAEVLLAAAGRDIATGPNNSLIPAWLAKLELVVEARLDDGAFYLATSPDNVDTLERAWLEADNGPVIEEEDAFKTDARSYKIRHVCGCRWLDWRGIVKVPVSG